jgi:hypothetical protein
MQRKTTEIWHPQCKICCSKKKKIGVPIIKDLLSSHGEVWKTITSDQGMIGLMKPWKNNALSADSTA